MNTPAPGPICKQAPETVVRVQGNYPDVWGRQREPRGRAHQWLRQHMARWAHHDLGNRFADPAGDYYETYAADSLEGALVEIWAHDVPDEATLLAATSVPQSSWDAPYDPWKLPKSSYEELFVWTLQPRDAVQYIDVSCVATRTWLRRAPALRNPLGLVGAGPVLASGLVEGDGPRSRIVTQAIAAVAYGGPGVVGIAYLSRYGNSEQNWAIFDKTFVGILDRTALDPTDPRAVQAAERLGLYLSAGATP